MKQPTLPMTGFPTRTISIACANVYQNIPAAEFTSPNNQPVIAMLISAELQAVRFTFGDVFPDQVIPTGHIMVPNGYLFLRIENPYAIRTFAFQNAAIDAAAIIHITLEFERSVV